MRGYWENDRRPLGIASRGSGGNVAKRNLFVTASMRGGNLPVVQTLVSVFAAMARYA